MLQHIQFIDSIKTTEKNMRQVAQLIIVLHNGNIN